MYQPPSFQTSIDLDLSRNEGRPTLERFDMDDETVRSLASRYPGTTRLTRLIAARHGIAEDRVLVTAGGDDAIFRCFLRAGRRRVVTTTPTFEMIPRYAAQAGSSLTQIPWWEGDIPVEDLTGTEAEMAVVVSPNNPTGSVIEERHLREIAAAFPLVVLDAAYVEFAERDLTPAGLRLGNVVVVRTLSKAFGLAGLRVGYLLGSPRVVAEIGAFGSPYAVSGLSAAIAAEVLKDGRKSVDGFVRAVVDERARLIEVLAELGARPLSSQANFVLATSTDPESMVAAAANLGVGLRRFPAQPGLERCVRIGLPGDADEFDRLVRVLRRVLASGQSEASEVADVW